MEPYGLTTLINLLNHPYVVRNRLAEALYGETGAAAFTRLMSRARGRHRFREEEVRGLIKLFRRLAGKLERRAEKLQGLDLTQLTPRRIIRLLELPELNLKPLVETALGKGNYYAFYDRARNRAQLPEEWRGAVAEELQRFATEIREQCDVAKQEARGYPFSVGKGGGSHLK